MKIAGIIAEYDPFHQGHKAHIDATRNEGGATHVVAVLSGSFTQRGEPALFTKFQRAEMALKNGVDLVLELPLPWAMASAERFAEGGVATLAALGCVDVLSFGSECGDTALLRELAALTDTPAFTDAFLRALDGGLSYAAARQTAAEQICGDKASAFTLPNNTLALEYIRAVGRLGADFDLFTLKRQGSDHHGDPQGDYAAAGWIRRQVKEDNPNAATPYMPAASAAVMADALTAGHAATQPEKPDTALLWQLRRMTVADFAALPYVSEGLEHRLWQAARTATTVEEWLTAVKTKRYPHARLRRILWAALLGADRSFEGLTPPYIRVLGMTRRGEEILAAANPTLPLLTRAAQVEALSDTARSLYELECRATDLQALAMPCPLPCGTDMTTKLLVLD